MGMGSAIRKGLRKLQAGGILLRELRGIRAELKRANDLKERELQAQGIGQPAPEDEADPAVLITEVDTQLAADMAGIELTLTMTLGQPPTEEQILEEYNRLHHEPDDPRRLSELERGSRQRGYQ